MTTLVVGATGQLGSEICRQLREGGKPVRALVRAGSSRGAELEASGIQTVAGDLKDPDSLAAACQGAISVVTTANTMMSRRRGDSFQTVESKGQAALLRASERNGVQRFVYVSLSPFTPADSPFVRSKREFENVVRDSDMEWTILQPTAYMETSFSPAAGWDTNRGRVVIIGPGTASVSYISLVDVASFAVHSIDSPAAARRELPLGGPEALSALEAVRVFEDVMERPIKIRHLPMWLPRLMRVLFMPFSPRLASLAALASAGGDVIPMEETLQEFPVPLTSLRKFASRLPRRARKASPAP